MDILSSRSRLVFVCVFVLCLAADFVLARHLLPNSDSVQSYTEMLAVRSGNVRLQHWVLATDDYILTDLAPMLAGSLVLGRGAALIYVVPFVVFASMLATAIQIVRTVARTHEGRLAGAYAVLLLFGIPWSLLYNFFFWSDFHVATITLALVAILAIAPAWSGEAFHRWRLLPFTCLVFAAAFSDPLADILLAAPVVFLVMLRAWSSGASRSDEWLVAGCAAFGAAGGMIALHLLVRSGASFSIRPSASLDLVPNIGAALRDFHAILGAEQVLFNARARLIRTLPLHELIAALRLLTAFGVATLCGAVLWRLPRSPQAGTAQLLVAGGLCVTTLATFSSTFAASVASGDDFPGAAVRFGVPIFVFLGLAAALELANLASRLRPHWLLAAGSCLALVQASGAGVATFKAAEAPAGIHAGPDAALAAWLLRNHFSYGIGDYWDTQLVEALTCGAVQADPVVNIGGPLQLWPWLTDTSRFGPHNKPQFAIIRPYGLFRVDLASITRTYGTPVDITLVANQFYVARLTTSSRGLGGADATPTACLGK
jgi:hypothetical protein